MANNLGWSSIYAVENDTHDMRRLSSGNHEFVSELGRTQYIIRHNAINCSATVMSRQFYPPHSENIVTVPTFRCLYTRSLMILSAGLIQVAVCGYVMTIKTEYCMCECNDLVTARDITEKRRVYIYLTLRCKMGPNFILLCFKNSQILFS